MVMIYHWIESVKKSQNTQNSKKTNTVLLYLQMMSEWPLVHPPTHREKNTIQPPPATVRTVRVLPLLLSTVWGQTWVQQPVNNGGEGHYKVEKKSPVISLGNP